MTRRPLFLGGLALVLLLAVGLGLWQFASTPATARAPHSYQGGSGAEADGEMQMPRPEPGGELEAELSAVLSEVAETPSLRSSPHESGFYPSEAIIEMNRQEDPASAQRYREAGLAGGYYKVLRGDGGSPEIQASVLRFSAHNAAVNELNYGRSTEAEGDSTVWRQELPSFEVAAKASDGKGPAFAHLISWVQGRDLVVVAVLAPKPSQAEALAEGYAQRILVAA